MQFFFQIETTDSLKPQKHRVVLNKNYVSCNRKQEVRLISLSFLVDSVNDNENLRETNVTKEML